MINLRHIHYIYKTIKKDIAVSLEKKDYVNALLKIDAFSHVAQLVNDIFYDEDIEYYISRVSKEAIGVTDSSTQKQDNRVVFYDQVGSTVCLSLQYIRSLNALGYKVLYIFENNFLDVADGLKEEVENTCEKSLFYKKYSIGAAKEIKQAIIDFQASSILVHSPAHGALGSSVLYSLPSIRRIRIVPGDMHFYQGVGCIDHFIEYRDYGVNVAIQRRGIPKERISKLIYYPIINSNVPFCGFPSYDSGTVVFAAAANEYKFRGSDKFFVLTRELLDRFTNVVFLFIGNDQSRAFQLKQKYHLNDRFIPLGYRRDFVECMRRIDVFVNSYPYGSALTSMTAAFFSKPILSIHDKQKEATSLNGWFGGNKISFHSEKEFREYAEKLVTSPEYRKREGMRVKSLLQTEQGFIEGLGHILKDGNYNLDYKQYDLSFLTQDSDIYLKIQNEYRFTILQELYCYYGIICFLKFPFLLFQQATYRQLFYYFKRKKLK